MSYKVKHTLNERNLTKEWQEFDDGLFVRKLPNGYLQIGEVESEIEKIVFSNHKEIHGRIYHKFSSLESRINSLEDKLNIKEK